MDEERTVFCQECAPGHWVRIRVCGEVDEEVLHSIASYVQLQRTFLARLENEIKQPKEEINGEN